MKPFLIIGSGGHGKSVLDCLLQLYSDVDIVFASNDASPSPIPGFRILNENRISTEEMISDYCGVVVAIGDNYARMNKIKRLAAAGVSLPSIIHPNASISPLSTIGRGSVVLASAVVNSFACVGDGCIINTGAIVEHECQIGQGVHLSPKVALGGGTIIGDRTWLCIGSSVSDHVSVPCDSVVAAGSVVLDTFKQGGLYAGVPAVLKRSY